MSWSTKVADFIASRGRLEFRQPANRVIQELNKLTNPKTENGIAPLDLGDAVGIGINRQRKTLLSLGAFLLFGSLLVIPLIMGPSIQWRDPETGKLSGLTVVFPAFGAILAFIVLDFVRKPGPEVVVVANRSGLYVVSRGLRDMPKETFVPWSASTIRIEAMTMNNKPFTTHSISLVRISRASRSKSRLFTTVVEEPVYRHWQQFSNAIARFG